MASQHEAGSSAAVQSGNWRNKMKLSKSILEMKFMKRTKEKMEQQLYQEEGEEYFCNQLTLRMKTASGRFIIEPSFVFCEELIDGRLSFQGTNPEIERLMELEGIAKRTKVEKEGETEISDSQMAKWNMSLQHRTGGIERNDKRSLHRNIHIEPDMKKPKFLKPAD